MNKKFAFDPINPQLPRRFVLVGGFLLAGKTNLIGQLKRYLSVRELKVGLVTYDQGLGLMDTDSAHSTEDQTVEKITVTAPSAVWTNSQRPLTGRTTPRGLP